MSMHHLRGGRALVAGAATAALLLGGALGASAEPINPATGQVDLSRSIDGTGSDTTQDVLNGLAAVTLDADEELFLGSWNATGTPTSFQTRTGGPTIPRPNGSSQGVAALRAAVNGTTLTNPNGTSSAPLSRADLQFARSSSGVAPSTSGALSYVPMAVDAVSFAVHEDNTSVPRNLTLADLTAIYRAANGASVTLSSGTFTVGREGTGAQIVPFIPQAGSGTRSFWISTVVGSEANLGTAVTDAFTENGTGQSRIVQEHDGAVLADVPNSIAPFSIAQYVAQTRVAGSPTYYSSAYGVQVTNRRNGAELGTVNGVQPLVSGRLNTAFPIARAVFNVVENAAVATNADLRHAFYNDLATPAVEGAIYSAVRPGTTSTLVIEDFGFGSLGSAGVTIGDNLYRAGDTVNYRAN